MADSPQTAIRVGDDILHSEAHHWGVLGIIGGAVLGLAVGVLLVGGTIATGGALAVVVGATLLGGGLVGHFGEILGRHHSAGAKGKVLTGSPNVFIGDDKSPAARAEADVAHCEDHSDSESAHDQPGVRGHRIAQGSEHVLINGHYAARKGDKGTCDFTLGDGWPTVVIGGPPKTVAGMKITSETASLDGLILGMTILGGILMAAPAVVGIIGEGLVGGLGWQAIGGIAEQLGGRIVVPLLRGIVFSKVIGHGLGQFGGWAFGQGSEGQEVLQFLGEVGGGFAGGMGEAGAGEAGAGEAGAGEAGTQRYGGTGADPEITSTPEAQARANAAYDQIRANDDVAQVAQNTGHSPEQIQAVKDHLFNSQHEIFDPETGTSAPGNFTPDEGTANLWNKAADGSLGQPRLNKWGDPIPGTENPGEVTDFNRLIAHEYVEQGLTSDGLPYQHPDSWVQDANGEWQYQPGPDNFGAHDLSPNFREDPFSHYESLLDRSSEGIPRPNADNSNLDDVLAGVRRSLGRDGNPEGPGGGGPAGPKGGPNTGGPSARGPSGGSEEPFTPARPLPPNPPEGRPIAPAPDAEPPAAPDAAPGGEPGTGTAAETTEPLPPSDPQGPTPEPAPEAATMDSSLSQGVSESQAAYQRVQEATADLPKSLEDKCVATDGGKTMSGYEGKNPRNLPDGYSEAKPDQIREYSKTIGHDLAPKKPNFMDGLDNDGNSLPDSDGWAGKYNSVHAEKQLGFLKPNDPIAVNKPMCSDCQSFFRQQAMHLQQDQFVTDPNGTWTYQSDGTVLRPDGTTVAPGAPLQLPKTGPKKTSSQLLDIIGDSLGDGSPQP